jgi:formylglycine-generating enzyme required for sulfatase activity
MVRLQLFLLPLVLSIPSLLLFSQNRGMKTTEQELRTEKRVALVIGNGAYKSITPLKNPPNDAKAMAAALRSLGFDVISKINVDKREMREAINQFGVEIQGSGVGLFYYAGHGVQSSGRNYLIPVNASIGSEGDVEDEAVSVDQILSRMGDARNRMNVVILDACRNNPFSSYRSLSRGLTQMLAPSGTFIAYSTAPGSVAEDGKGANGVYTQALLKEIKVPGVPLEDMFKNVLSDVKRQTRGKQIPWTSSSVEGDFYFNSWGVVFDTKTAVTRKPGQNKNEKDEPKETTDPWLKDLETKARERERAEEAKKAEARKMKAAIDAKIEAMADDFAKVEGIEKTPIDDKDKAEAWSRFLDRYKEDIPNDNRDDDMRAKATMRKLDLIPRPTLVSNSIGMEFVLVQPGTFQMGSNDGSDDERPVHSVTISKPFYIGKYEVTQAQWMAVMGSNPSGFKGDNRPVETVSWNDAHDFIRKLNDKENTGKYRLPTEAEWEFAARGGTQARGFKFSGSNDVGDVAVCSSNSGNETKPVGSKQPNELGIFDMSGNVWEWCEDWYGNYDGSSVTDPAGPSSGQSRVLRGGSWFDNVFLCRSANRLRYYPDSRFSSLGFRLVQDLK